MSECEKILSMLDEYIDDELSKTEKEEVKEHLSFCDKCRSEYEFKISIIKVTKEIDIPDLPEDFSKVVMEKIKKEKKKAFFSPRIINSVAACFVVAVVLGVWGNFANNKKPQNDVFYPVPVQDEAWTVLSPADSNDEEASAFSPRMINPDAQATVEAIKIKNVFFVDEENFAFAKEFGKICGEYDGEEYKMPKDAFILFIQNLSNLGAKIEFDFSLEEEITFTIEKK